ncbi:hypothetical protein SAMN04487911_102238 [Arenibacter nanhaiticus]|uniref:Uncharacterized protein n=1 Tax=Arenibacter nanhaiticus TaxID=558155 RepID=A0A1M6BL27_9FLAO|nr:hypothetical protein SAMN04487911_102238 [Arenibacter nanhaiticus]
MEQPLSKHFFAKQGCSKNSDKESVQEFLSPTADGTTFYMCRNILGVPLRVALSAVSFLNGHSPLKKDAAAIANAFSNEN